MVRIILADDHMIFRQGLASLLQTNGDLELLAEAGNGDEAWRLIKQLRPDVSILDITMPGLSGIDVASRVARKADIDTRIVLLTSHDDPTLAIQGQEAGAVGYVLKENAYEELLQAIKIVAAGGQFMSPQIVRKVDEILRTGQRTTLSFRERQVLAQIGTGMTDKEIAYALKISPNTVKTYMTRIKEKLNLRTKAQLAAHAEKIGLTK